LTAHPLTRLRATSFGAFADIDVELAPGLNVIIGENGAGKSQLTKLLYTATNVLSTPDALASAAPRKSAMNTAVAAKLMGVFRPESLGRLTNRRRGRTRAQVAVTLAGSGTMSFAFANTAKTEVQTDELPEGWIADSAVYLPTRELLSIYPGFVSLYNERRVEFDETWRDTADLLGRVPLRGPRESKVRSVLAPLEEALGGNVVEENGRFYLQQRGVGKLEMHLVAEGLRKLAMLVRLVSSGTLLTSGYLFWDEPETNLNPKTLREVAATIVSLSREGVQVFIATHSLFLLREIEILLATDARDLRASTTFIGLHRTEEGVVVEQGSTVADVGDISALHAELRQAGEYLEQVE